MVSSVLTYSGSLIGNGLEALSRAITPSRERLQNLVRKISIFSKELFATLAYTLPNFLKWHFRVSILGTIKTYPVYISINNTKHVAHLYFHENSKINKSEKQFLALFLHGDHGHPFSTLNLADLITQRNGHVFSLQLPYSDDHSESNRALLAKSIDMIHEIAVTKRISHQGLIGIAHSIGAIQIAYRMFVEDDTRIKAVILIAGRLKVTAAPDRACRRPLIPYVNALYQEIQNKVYLPLYQIVAGKDWCIPPEATAIRQDKKHYHIVKEALHLNVLYQEETKSKLCEFYGVVGAL